MIELAAALTLLLADWGAAASHMAYVSTKITHDEPPLYKGEFLVPPTMHPFYARTLPLLGDMFHMIAGLRYLPMAFLAYLVFGNPIEGWTLHWSSWHFSIPLFWWLGTALTDSIGWQVLKHIHNKSWPLHRWLA